MTLTAEQRLDIVRRAISTKDGWKQLAQAAKASPEDKAQYLDLLKQAAGDRDMPVLSPDGKTLIRVKMADWFAQQLDANIAELEQEAK